MDGTGWDGLLRDAVFGRREGGLEFRMGIMAKHESYIEFESMDRTY
jgi:hypothetical protein